MLTKRERRLRAKRRNEARHEANVAQHAAEEARALEEGERALEAARLAEIREQEEARDREIVKTSPIIGVNVYHEEHDAGCEDGVFYTRQLAGLHVWVEVRDVSKEQYLCSFANLGSSRIEKKIEVARSFLEPIIGKTMEEARQMLANFRNYADVRKGTLR